MTDMLQKAVNSEWYSLRIQTLKRRVTLKTKSDILLSVFLPVLLLSLLFAAGGNSSAYASEKIGSVKVNFEAGDTGEDGLPEIEPETDNAKYSVSGVLTLEDYEADWDEDDEDADKNKKDNSDLLAWNATYRAMEDHTNVTYAVELTASEGYYFSSELDKVKLSGLGAECVRLERLNSKTTLTLFVKFTGLTDLAKQVENAVWSSDGYASWQSADAAWYELRFYAGKKLKGDRKTTGSNVYDFRPWLQSAGIYHYAVRSVSGTGETGAWTESASFIVTEEMALDYKDKFGLVAAQDGQRTAPSDPLTYMNTGWQQTEDGKYWYREQDAGYPQKSWLIVEGSWYFFDEGGYMVAGTYVKWGNDTYYVDEGGKMITSQKAPDGRVAGEDGRLVWPER